MTEVNASRYMKKSRRTSLGIAIGALVAIFVIVWFVRGDETPAEESVGYTSEPIVLGDVSYEVTGSKYVGDEHTFYLTLKNVGNSPESASTTFNIINGDKRFASSDASYSTSKLNPGIDGTVAVTFTMNLEDLTEGSPVLELKRGMFGQEKTEIPLVK